MSQNNFDVNILVNGNHCKKYSFQNKVYIEAKNNSVYEIEIKNNTWQKVLCLASVDGLSVLNGTPASDNDNGYIIQSHSPLRIKGFRYSNDEVAAFKFTNKENSYAQSVGGTEAAYNCGVIGVKIWSEYVEYIPPINTYWYSGKQFYDEPPFQTTCGSPNSTLSGFSRTITTCCNDMSSVKCSAGYDDSPPKNFDMGSTWGQKRESKVTETNFNRGCLQFTFDVYYASRQALINMGVPLNTGNQISFPQSFPKYAKPPKNWNG